MGTYYLISLYLLQCSLCPQLKQLELAKLCHFVCFPLYETFFCVCFNCNTKKSVSLSPLLLLSWPNERLIIYTNGISPREERERKREGVKWREIVLALLVWS